MFVFFWKKRNDIYDCLKRTVSMLLESSISTFSSLAIKTNLRKKLTFEIMVGIRILYENRFPNKLLDHDDEQHT